MCKDGAPWSEAPDIYIQRIIMKLGLSGGLVVKNPPANAGDTCDEGSVPESGRPPGRRAWLPTPVFLPGESHGQRSLEGYSL